jgi:hypothetical protein
MKHEAPAGAWQILAALGSDEKGLAARVLIVCFRAFSGSCMFLLVLVAV